MKKCLFVLLTLLIILIALPALAEETSYPEKVFDEPKYEYTVTEKDGLIIPIDFKGMPLQYIEHKAANDKSFYYYLDNSGLHIFPIQKGKATITLTNKRNKKDKTVLTIIIADSAVYGKGEDSPLRVYLVAEESIVTNDIIKGKYIILGGTGKYDYVIANYEYMYFGNYISGMHLNTRQKKNIGTFSINRFGYNTEYYRFHITAWDTDGNKAEAVSQVVEAKCDSDLQLMLDTVIFTLPREYGFHFQYHVKGGKEPYTCTWYYNDPDKGISKTKLSGKAGENTFDYDLPKARPYEETYSTFAYMEAVDSAKNKQERVFWVYNEGDKYYALKCDKPFAKVGDEVNVEFIREGTWSNIELNKEQKLEFFYVNYDIGYKELPSGKLEQNFSLERIPLTEFQKTDNGYSLICEKPGMIYVGRDSSECFCLTFVE